MRDIPTEVAGEFICNECGRNSYFCWTKMSVSDLASSVNEDDADEFNPRYDDEDQEGFIFTEPSKVKCDYCQKIYEVCNDPDGEHAIPHRIETTETFQAAEFVCEDCNTVNHFSLVVPNDHTSESEGGHPTWVMYPTKVTCKKCKAEFNPVSDYDGEKDTETE